MSIRLQLDIQESISAVITRFGEKGLSDSGIGGLVIADNNWHDISTRGAAMVGELEVGKRGIFKVLRE